MNERALPGGGGRRMWEGSCIQGLSAKRRAHVDCPHPPPWDLAWPVQDHSSCMYLGALDQLPNLLSSRRSFLRSFIILPHWQLQPASSPSSIYIAFAQVAALTLARVQRCRQQSCGLLDPSPPRTLQSKSTYKPATLPQSSPSQAVMQLQIPPDPAGTHPPDPAQLRSPPSPVLPPMIPITHPSPHQPPPHPPHTNSRPPAPGDTHPPLPPLPYPPHPSRHPPPHDDRRYHGTDRFPPLPHYLPSHGLYISSSTAEKPKLPRASQVGLGSAVTEAHG